jgi:hypothetical protein
MRFTWLACLVLTFCIPTFADEPTTSAQVSGVSELSWFGFEFGYSPVRYTKYQVTDATTGGGLSHMARAAVDWMPIQTVGKLSVGIGLGVSFRSNIDLGNGGDLANVFTFPIEGFLAYRFDYFENQIVVPFFQAGGELTWVKEYATLDVGRHSVARAYKGLDYGAGLEICLNNIDSGASYSMKTNFGILRSYLVVAYLRSKILGTATDPDLSRDEFRFGFRFEI